MRRVWIIAWLAACGHAPAPAPTCALSYLAADICEPALAMKLPAQLPPARGNQYGDSDDAAMLGFTLFFDPNLGTGVGCETCHLPESAFTTHTPVSTGKGVGTRNAPTAFNAARQTVFFWDGRADSLWSQPLFAIENPLEMGSSRLALAHTVATDTTITAGYEKIFGPLPDMSAWPAEGKPGDAAFDTLPADTQTLVNRIAANVGKALEAYMRKNTTGEARIDRFLAGDATQLTASAQHGLSVFIAQKCNSCHSGAIFSDEQFHDVGFPSLPGAAVDVGRPAGIPILLGSIFNLGGPFADPDTFATAPAPAPSVSGAFRTPGLRNIERTGPYGHDGALASIADVLTLHAPTVSASDRTDLIAFFQSLDGDYPALPWSNWPVPQ